MRKWVWAGMSVGHGTPFSGTYVGGLIEQGCKGLRQWLQVARSAALAEREVRLRAAVEKRMKECFLRGVSALNMEVCWLP